MVKSKFFTEAIPSNEAYTEFMIDIFEKILDQNLPEFSDLEKQKIEAVLDSSFNQIIILKEKMDNIPFNDFYKEYNTTRH